MAPMHWNGRHRLLHLGFLRSVEHRALAAIESILKCRAEACLITPSHFRDALPPNGRDHVAQFSLRQSVAAMSETVLNYMEATGTTEVRAAAMAGCIWARLVCNGPPFDLLFANNEFVRA
jgi:hypothetical protein